MKIINQNINNSPVLHPQNIGFKAELPQVLQADNQVNEQSEIPEVELPEMYYMPENYKKPKTFAESIKKVDVMGLIHPWFEHPLLMIATCAGLSAGVDAFDKSCNKEYEKSIVGRAAKFGDNIEQSEFIQNDTSQKALSRIKKGWNKVKTAAMKNNMINAMVTTPSEPEWAIPKDELKHSNYRIVTKFKELASAFDMVPGVVNSDGTHRREFHIKDLALSGDEIDNLKKLYNVEKISMIPEEEVVNRVMLQRLGKDEKEISSIIKKGNASDLVAKELFKKSGLTTAELEAIFKDETGETFELVKKASGNLKGTRLAHGKIVIPGPRQPFANVEGFEGLYNRAHSMSDGAATKTGRFMSKLVQKIYRGFTFGNQKQAVLIWVTPFLVGSIINTIRADKEEKVGTAVSGIINAFSWVFTFPIALRGIHAFGGIQYTGMGKEKVDEYKRIVHEFNDKVNAGEFANISEYRAAKKSVKKQLKDLRKVHNQTLLTDMLRGVSKFSKADLLKLESYKNGSGMGDLFRKLPNLIKDYLIYAPGRMIVFMFVGLAFADKIIDKCLSLIFGKPYDGFKDDELKESKNRQEEYSINNLRDRLLQIQREKLYPSENENMNELSDSNKKSAVVPLSMLRLAELAEKNQHESAEILDNSNISELEEEQISDETVVEELTGKDNEADVLPEDDLVVDEPEETIQPVETADNIEIDEDMLKQAEELPKLPNILIPQPANELLSEDENDDVVIEELPELEDIDNQTENLTKEDNYLPETVNADNNELIQPVDNQVVKSPDIVKHDVYTYIPSQNSIFDKSNPTQPVYKYIPSQTGIKINKVFDNSALEAALRRANRAEQNALDVLAGNFGNM